MHENMAGFKMFLKIKLYVVFKREEIHSFDLNDLRRELVVSNT